MTVPVDLNVVTYRGNSTTTVFPYSFKIPEADMVLIRIQDFTTKAITQTLNSGQYSITGIGGNGGSVTYPLTGDPLTSDFNIIIQRVVPYTQELDIVNQGGFYPESLEDQLDLTAMQIQQLAEEVGRTFKVPSGETGETIDGASERAGKYLVYGPAGELTTSDGSGSDGALRADLAGTDGGSYVGHGADTVEDILNRMVDALADVAALTYADVAEDDIIRITKEGLAIKVLNAAATNAPIDHAAAGGIKATFVDGVVRHFSWGLKETARSQAEAQTMAEDLTDMVGYAAAAGTDGGAGGATYWITHSRDDLSEGSIRWAVAQVAADTLGFALFHPRGQFHVHLKSQLELPDNITLDAPGRNATIWRPFDVTGIKVIEPNTIVRRLKIGQTYDAATATVRDGVWVEISTANKVWLDQITPVRPGDAGIDINSISELTADCNITVSHCHLINNDKTMMIGSLACYNAGPPAWCPTATAETPHLFCTLFENFFDGCAQRQPKVVSQAFVDSVNNVRRMVYANRDDGSNSSVYGILAATGGMVHSRGDLFLSAYGTLQPGTAVEYKGVYAITTAQVPSGGGVGATDGPGCTKITGSIAESPISLVEFNDTLVPDYSLTYTLNAAAITDTPAGRRAFMEGIMAKVGATADAAPEGAFRWDGASDVYPDSISVVSETNDVGRWLRIDRSTELPRLTGEKKLDTIITARGSTLTIAAGVITIPESGTFFAVDTEAAAGTDDLDTINGFVDNRWLLIRAASGARDVVVKAGTGNIVAAADITLDTATKLVLLIYDDVADKWIAFPVGGA